jgi:acyl-CoA synthetase (AMP-forming)/AMP-acid ligase II
VKPGLLTNAELPSFGFLQRNKYLSYSLEKAGLHKGDRIESSQNCYEFVLLYGAAARLGLTCSINWRLSAPEVEYILTDGQPRFSSWGLIIKPQSGI